MNITVKIEDLSLVKALGRILNNHNFVIFYQADGNIRIMVYDDAGGSAIAQFKEASL